jgi:hypothetical protein
MAAAQSGEPAWKLSGYYLNLYTMSSTLVGPEEHYALDMNRVRLRLEGAVVRSISLELQYDNEVILGNYLGTQQFALLKEQIPNTTLDLERTYADRRQLFAQHRMHRAMLSWSGREFDLTLGRQRIAWGTGMFWSPLDILNPLDPSRIERTERVGVDALLVGRKLGPLGKVNAVIAPRTEFAASAVAGYLHDNIRGTDFSLVAGNFRGDRVLGMDFAGRIGDVGVRGEATAVRSDRGRDYFEALLGVDNGFSNSLSLTGELHYNGRGATDPARYDFESLFAGRVHSVARRYGAAAATYAVTPLIELAIRGIVNIDDGSLLLWPEIEYSLASNIDASCGIQYFSGGAGSEYGRQRNVLYLKAQYFF